MVSYAEFAYHRGVSINIFNITDNIVFFGKWQQYPAMLAVIFNLHKCRIFLTINLYMLINLQ